MQNLYKKTKTEDSEDCQPIYCQHYSIDFISIWSMLLMIERNMLPKKDQISNKFMLNQRYYHFNLPKNFMVHGVHYDAVVKE